MSSRLLAGSLAGMVVFSASAMLAQPPCPPLRIPLVFEDPPFKAWYDGTGQLQEYPLQPYTRLTFKVEDMSCVTGRADWHISCRSGRDIHFQFRVILQNDKHLVVEMQQVTGAQGQVSQACNKGNTGDDDVYVKVEVNLESQNQNRPIALIFSECGGKEDHMCNKKLGHWLVFR